MKSLLLALAVLTTYAAYSYSAEDKSETATGAPPLVHVIYLGGAEAASYVLENVEAVDFKGVKCLKGRHANITWAKGKTCYVPVDKIELVMEFESFEAYKHEMREHQDARLK